jgi:hypothetical protein
MLKDLIKLATHLDNIGRSIEANQLDAIIKKMAGEDYQGVPPAKVLKEMIDDARSKILAVKTFFDSDHNPFEQPLDEKNLETVYGRASMLLDSLNELKDHYFSDNSMPIMTPEDEASANEVGSHSDAYGAINLALGAKDILRKSSTFVANNSSAFTYSGKLEKDLFMASNIGEEISNMIYDRYHPHSVGGKDSFRYLGDSKNLQDNDTMRGLFEANKTKNNIFNRR